MLSFCLEYKKKIESKNPMVLNTTRKPRGFGTGEQWQPNNNKRFPVQMPTIHMIYCDHGCVSIKKMTKFIYSDQLGSY